MQQAYLPDFYISLADGSALTDATAAGTGDATAINGAWLDARAYSACKVGAIYVTALTAAKTLTLACIVQTASDSSGTGATTLATLTSKVVTATGNGVHLFPEAVLLDKSTNLGFIRTVLTPDLSHTGTDTATVGAFFVLGPNRTALS